MATCKSWLKDNWDEHSTREALVDAAVEGTGCTRSYVLRMIRKIEDDDFSGVEAVNDSSRRRPFASDSEVLDVYDLLHKQMGVPPSKNEWIRAAGIGFRRATRLEKKEGLEFDSEKRHDSDSESPEASKVSGAPRVDPKKPPEPCDPQFKQDEEDPNKAHAWAVSDEITSIDDLLDRCKVDTDVWEVDVPVIKAWSGYRREEYKDLKYTDGKASGFVRDTGKIMTKPLYYVSCVLKRKIPMNQEYAMQAYMDLVESVQPDWEGAAILVPGSHGKRLLARIDMPDIHLGQSSWPMETGDTPYTTKIAAQLMLDAVWGVLGRLGNDIYQIEEFHLDIGHDFFNVDNHERTTTKGTPQDEDGRWQYTYWVGLCSLFAMVGHLSTIAPVKVDYVPGNHDYQRSYYACAALWGAFKENKNVEVNLSPNPIKYRRWHNCLFGACHGKEQKYKDLPLLMATSKESSADFAETEHRIWYVGDKHIHMVYEKMGVKVIWTPSLAPADAWHSRNCYQGHHRQVRLSLFDREDGPVSEHIWSVPSDWEPDEDRETWRIVANLLREMG